MRIFAIVKRIIKQFARDKRTLALMLVAPLLILTLMYLVFAYDEYKPTIITYNLPPSITEALEQRGAIILVDSVERNISPEKERRIMIESHNADAYVSLNVHAQTPKLSVTLEGSDSIINQSILLLVQQAASDSMVSSDFAYELSYIYGGADLTLFDTIGPILIGFFIFFFVFLISGVSFLRERTTGTLERLLATPLRRWELVLGYILGFGIFTTLQAALISWYAISVLGVIQAGAFFSVLLITFLLAMTALTLGTLLSAFANNELQMVQFIPIVIIPQVFFCGLFNLDAMPTWLSSISYIMPLTYGAEALQEIMIRGKGINDVLPNILILLGFATAFCLLNVQALKKHRQL
ncbi:ABC transporter permease [Desulfuribacillus alkaliarsenatis]|uniref:ABC transporter permease n=1 Tax=Desulfuribacillus alkaliarsenatis TaxID=766136 RepID=A0A1E5G3C6_9FIRM|nr:ABC transporter permease [Desulfuribacillus alkaliarsenatis]OEF97484.1 ABC transporter permease [Desulfuribacillus alkaliarsenatis]